MCSLAFQSESGSAQRSRDNATFRRNLLGTAFAWQMRSRYAAGEGAHRDFQTVGLNGVFGYFCRRGQKYPAPGRGISLWTIPPSRPLAVTPPSQREARGTDSHASDIGHWLGMTGRGQGVGTVDVRRGGALPRPLFTIPPSTIRVDTSLTEGGEGNGFPRQ